jgi:type II secretory pathway pseudopilin PulG
VETGGSNGAGDGERGETLLEMLITIILMGTAVVGILAGLVAVTNLASRNSQTTHVRNSAQSYAELLKQPVQSFEYVPCADASTYGAIPADLLPTDYEAEIVAIQYAALVPNGGPANSVRFNDAQPSTCPTTDNGLQRLVIEVRSGPGGDALSETVAIVKRDARCSGTYQNVDQGPC